MTQNQEVRRTALLVRCTAKEAELIRQAARAERRTISGYILNCILHRISIHARTQKQFREMLEKAPTKPSIKKAKAQSSGT